MSSHFNYEIDERNLRVRLKDMNFPIKEEAWIEFENYSDNCKSHHNHKTNVLPRFQLNINRNIILPVAFGGIIILFSFLLFNFVSIKNKPANKQETKLVLQDPVKESVVAEDKNVVVSPAEKNIEVTTTQKIDSTQLKLAAKPQPRITETKRVELEKNSVATVTMPTINNVTDDSQKISQGNGWTTTETAEIFSRPDNHSEILGSAAAYRAYEAIEETNYYIKINYQANGTAQQGYIRKQQLRRNIRQGTGGYEKKIVRKAEVIESIKAPTLPTSEEKEPELK